MEWYVGQQDLEIPQTQRLVVACAGCLQLRGVGSKAPHLTLTVALQCEDEFVCLTVCAKTERDEEERKKESVCERGSAFSAPTCVRSVTEPDFPI